MTKQTAIAVLIGIAAITLLGAGEFIWNSQATKTQELQSAETKRDTIACLKLEDLQRAIILATPENAMAAISGLKYAMDHGCTLISENTFVKIEKTIEAKYVCIRPRGSDTCLWSPAESIQIVQAD